MTPTLDAIVLENARVCNLRCAACPTVHAVGYPGGIMSMGIFERILEHISPAIFPRCGLTGWGETLLDPTYFAKLTELKRRGYYVGSTSNATLLDADRVRRLLDCGLDQLGLSVDIFHLESSRSTPEAVAARLRDALAPLAGDSSSFTLGLNVVVPRRGLEFFLELLALLDGLPFRQISAIPLILIPTRELVAEAMPASTWRQLLERCRKRWPDRNLAFAYLDPPEAGNCRSDVHRNVYVSHDGRVSPCCILAMEFPNYTFAGDARRTTVLDFGNLAERAFAEIWGSPNYLAFRRRFQQGSIPPACACCNAWRPLPEDQPNHAH